MKYEDKVGDELKQQRFQMLQDIAEELSGEITFPTTFDLTEITDIKRAVVRLGMNVVRNTALSIAIQQMRRAKSMLVFKDLSQQLWDHSIRTASSACILARHYGAYNPDEAMLAGMIHDIGAFYLLYRASQYEELVARPDTVKHLVFRWHEGIGSILLETLGVPEEIILATREHDVPRPDKVTVKTLSDIIYVANILSGSAFELEYIDDVAIEQKIIELTQKYEGLSEEIDQYEAELRTIFS